MDGQLLQNLDEILDKVAGLFWGVLLAYNFKVNNISTVAKCWFFCTYIFHGKRDRSEFCELGASA
jgi:hypothetical protein